MAVNTSVSNDANLELLLGTLGLKYQLYEVNAIQFAHDDVLEEDYIETGANFNSLGYYRCKTPADFENLFGTGFGYAPFYQNWPSLKPLPNYNEKYIRPRGEIDYITEYEVMDSDEWAHEISEDYLRGESKDLSETLYFASGA